jgi:hypothetical protein
MNLSQEQLDEMRAKIDSEYQKDIEALARLSRFLPSSVAPPVMSSPAPVTAALVDAADTVDAEHTSESLIDAVYRIVTSHDRSFNSRTVYYALHEEGYPLPDRHQAMATIGTSLAKLTTRHRIRLTRRGKGRQPNVYRANSQTVGVTPVEGIAGVLTQ